MTGAARSRASQRITRPSTYAPAPTANAALRALVASGRTVGVYTDAPVELARVALAHLGAGRRVADLEAGAGARQRLLERLGPESTELAETEEALVRIGDGGAEAPR